MENPIKYNRFVGDITFAIRLLSYLEHNMDDALGINGPAAKEEHEYITRNAVNLLAYQFGGRGEMEDSYFQNIVKDGCRNASDLIRKRYGIELVAYLVDMGLIKESPKEKEE